MFAIFSTSKTVEALLTDYINSKIFNPFPLSNQCCFAAKKKPISDELEVLQHKIECAGGDRWGNYILLLSLANFVHFCVKVHALSRFYNSRIFQDLLASNLHDLNLAFRFKNSNCELDPFTGPFILPSRFFINEKRTTQQASSNIC